MSMLFGKAFREKHFTFDPAYTPLNHGSFGAFPIAVRNHQRSLQDSIESRSDPFLRYEVPKLLEQARVAAAEYIGTPADEVVFVPNATTTINTVLRSLVFQEGDVILNFPWAYGACEKTIQYVCETTAAEQRCIEVKLPTEDDELVNAFRKTVSQLQGERKKARIIMFDTVVSIPGNRLPWEKLVEACRDLDVLSLVDGAHAIGHIDLTKVHEVSPDFFTTNCYKWLYTPRGCSIFYVPSRNHHLIRSSVPTSDGYQRYSDSQQRVSDTSFVAHFDRPGTIDQTPYLCVAEAIKFRNEICGGENVIREYCFQLAERGGALMAAKLGTEVMYNSTRSANQCCFANVRLPFTFTASDSENTSQPEGNAFDSEDGPTIARWIISHSLSDHNTWIPTAFYNGHVWVRISAQIYLDETDFEFAADVLLELCSRVRQGDWKQ